MALNAYNAKIRTLVGEELKRQNNMNAFYWMMNKTGYIKEYLPEDEFYSRNYQDFPKISLTCLIAVVLVCIIPY